MVASLTVLGPTAVHVDGRAVAIGRRRERVLLGVLGLRTPRPVPAERLCGLWAETCVDATDLRRALHVSVSRLRRVLTPYGAGIDYRHGAYALVGGALVVDARRFRDLVAAGFAATDPKKAVTQLGAALDQWTGDALAELDCFTVRAVALAEVNELRMLALQRWVEMQTALGGHQEVISRLRPVVAERPTDENLVAQLMSALAGGGRLGEALELYLVTRQRLAEELGIDPCPELSERYQEMLRVESMAASRLRSAVRHRWSVREAVRAANCVPGRWGS
jgi:DNA-binding SARP family transcriptional activator